ncbi:hypothetical protein [Pengzhenrongella frigida]|uniref:Uncharacterized protein n=1 Tax=Pengzhenrongella frigida TaxID=1259133 RepID=A0A4Q5N3Q2_9MICO|nr:hypothetical protein [Cellulomonas sp. HLT2-17]RYV52862.1 hypothetical protein EUA98_01295 [Cellulomonas sp. HLT2-17]
MRRLFWIGVGAVATVVVIRKVRSLVDEHVPAGVTQAAGVVGGLSGALRSARSEFSAGLAEREAELRRDLLGDVDLDAARSRTESWRAERHAKRATSPDRTASSSESSDRAGRPGRHADDSELAQDPSDGELGYSFF